MDTLVIKNMVCNRCILVVKNELEKQGHVVKSRKLGEVTLEKEPSTEEKAKLNEVFLGLGFEIMDDKKSRIIEEIKRTIIKLVQDQNNDIRLKLNRDHLYII